MASEMKGELTDVLTASDSEGATSSPSTVRDRVDHAEIDHEPADLGIEPASPPVGDDEDEDVSLDELMMSDSTDDEEEATDVHAELNLWAPLAGPAGPAVIVAAESVGAHEPPVVAADPETITAPDGL